MTKIVDTIKFIEDVFERPAIWNRTFQGNKALIDETWEDLRIVHNIPITTLKAKWKGLRDMFRVEYKRIPRNEHGELLVDPYEHESRWTHYKALLFLMEHMRSRTQYKTKRYRLMYGDEDSNGEGSTTGVQYDDAYDEYDSFLNDPYSAYSMHGIENNMMMDNNELITGYADDDENDVIEVPDASPLRLQPTMMSTQTTTINAATPMNPIKLSPSPPVATSSTSTSTSKLKRYHQTTTTTAAAASASASINNSNQNNTNSKKRYNMKDIITTLNGSGVSVTSINTKGTPNSTKSYDDGISIDDDFHFLLSLHPYMTQIDVDRKLRVRMGIHDLIFKELYDDKDDNENIDEVE